MINHNRKYGKCTSPFRFCVEQARWSECGARELQVYDMYINCLGDFCQLLTFANSLDPDQAQQKVSRDQYPNCLTLWVRDLNLYLCIGARSAGPEEVF